MQSTTVKGWDGKSLPCRNLIAQYRPEAKERIVLAAHYDSRPWSEQDSDSTKHRQPVMAADDGASGVAVMLEVARNLQKLNPAVGIDFVCLMWKTMAHLIGLLNLHAMMKTPSVSVRSIGVHKPLPRAIEPVMASSSIWWVVVTINSILRAFL